MVFLTLGVQYASGQSCVEGNHCNNEQDVLLDCPDVPFAEYFWDARELGNITNPAKSIPGLVYKQDGNYYFSPSNIPASFLGVEFSVVLISGTPATEGAGYWSVSVRVMGAPTAYPLSGPTEVCKDEAFVLALENSETSTTSYRLYQVGSPTIKGISPGKNGAIDFPLTNSIVNDYTYYVVADNGNCQTTMPDSDPNNGWQVKVNDVPTVAITSDQTEDEFCVGTDVIFTATGANEYAFYLNTMANEVQPRGIDNTYNTSILNDGDVIIVEGYDTGTSAVTTCVATSSVAVTVNDLPTGDISGDNTICAGESTNLTFTLTGVAPWDIVYTDGTNDYNIAANSSPHNVGVTPLSGPVTYTIKTLTDAKSCGASTLTGSATISVNTRPTSVISGGGTICNGESSSFDITMTGTGPFTMTYTDGTTPVTLTDVASPQTITVNPTTTTTYTVTSLIDQNCSAHASDMTGSAIVNVNERPTSVISGGGTICDGGTSTFDIVMSGTGPFTLTYTDGTTPVTLTDVTSPQTITVNPSTTSTYTISALVDQNCSAQAGDMTGSATVNVNDRPTSVISGGGTICSGKSSTFDITMTGTGLFTVTYTDGTTPVTLIDVTSPQTIAVNPSTTTTYTVTALIDQNCTSVAGDMTGSATVNVNERPTSVISGGGTICNGGTSTFDIVMNGTGPFTVTYTDGTTPVTLTDVSSPQTITVNPTTTTTYSVTALTDQNCTALAGDMTGSATVNINERPTSVISGGGTICSGDEATFTINMTGAGPFTVTYTDGTTPVTLTNVASPQTITVNPTADATYTVTVLSDQNCSADVLAGDLTGSATVNVNERPVGSIAGGGTICLGESSTFDITMTGTGPFNVAYTDGTTPVTLNNITSPHTVTVSPNTTKTYSLVSLSDALCAADPATDISGSATVVVNSVTANISISAPVVGGTEICAGTIVTFNAAGIGGSGNYSFDFHRVRGGVDVSQQNTTTATYSDGTLQDGDVIYVKVIDNTTNCTDNSADVVMKVNANPVVALNITTPSSGSSTICTGTTVVFTATPGFDNYDFYINSTRVQSGTDNTYTSSTLVNGDQIYVDASEGSCHGSSAPSIVMVVNDLPAPTLVSDQPSNVACLAEEVTFTAGGGVLYEFFVNGVSQGAAAAGNEFKYTHATNDDYSVYVIVTDANTCSAASSPVVISTTPAVAALVADKTTICDGQDVNFTASGGTSYEFFVDGGAVQGPGALDTYVASGLTNGQVVSVNVINEYGCEDTHSGIAITVITNPVPTLSITNNGGSSVICDGETLDFEVTPTGFARYVFAIDGTSVQDGANNTLSYSGFNNGEKINVTAYTDLSGTACYGTSTDLTITVNARPTPAISGDMVVCPGSTKTYVADTPGLGKGEYTWVVTGGTATGDLDEETIEVTWGDGSVAASVSLNYVNISGCEALLPTTENITINIVTAGLVADKTTICTGEDVTFTASGGTTYKFYIDDIDQVVADPTATEFVASGLTDGQVVKVTAIDAIGCEDTHAEISITVVDTPNPTITAGPNSVCNGEEAVYTAETGYVNYVWNVVGGSVTAGDGTHEVTVKWVTDGAQSIDVTYASAGGTCVGATYTLPVTVNALPSGTSFDAEPSNNVIKGTDIKFTATGGDEYAFLVNGTEVQARSTTNTLVVSTEAPSANTVVTNGDVMRVVVYNAAGCSVSPPGITVGVYDGITPFDVIASAVGHCYGEAIEYIQLSGFQPGITYELFRVTAPEVSMGKITATSGTTTVKWETDLIGATTPVEYRVEAYYDGTPPTPAVPMINTVFVEEYDDLLSLTMSPTTAVDGKGTCGTTQNITLGESTAPNVTDPNVNYQLIVNSTTVVATLPGNGGQLNFGSPSVIGIYTINAVHATTGCEKLMDGDWEIEGIAVDTYDLVVGDDASSTSKDGRYCENDVDGVHLWLQNSESYTYELWLDGIQSGTLVTSVVSTGGAIDFGNITTEGRYEVTVNEGGCFYPMSNFIDVQKVSIPVVGNMIIDNNGHYCTNDLSGISITLDNQQKGIVYRLFRDNAELSNSEVVPTVALPLSGDASGAALSFGAYITEGTYFVSAEIDGLPGCKVNSNEGNIMIDPLPVTVTLQGDTEFCQGGEAQLFILNSEEKVDYELIHNGTPTGDIKSGDGSQIAWTVNVDGIYKIQAIKNNTNTTCGPVVMPDELALIEVPLPEDKTVNATAGDPALCEGTTIKVLAAETLYGNIRYAVVSNITNTELPGYSKLETEVNTDGDIVFDPISDNNGSYRVEAYNGTCSIVLDNTDVNPILIDNPNAVSRKQLEIPSAICEGDGAINISILATDLDVKYELRRTTTTGSDSISTITGDGSDMAFTNIFKEGEYYIIGYNPPLTTADPCSNEMLNRVVLKFNPLPIAYNLLGSGVSCGTDNPAVIGIDGSQSDVEYVLIYDNSGVGKEPVDTISGNGSKIYFEGVIAEGKYTVYAKSVTTECTSSMEGEVIVSTVTEVSNQELTKPNYVYCSNDVGAELVLQDQEFGVVYEVRDATGGTAIVSKTGDSPGTPLVLGIVPIGTYEVWGSYNGACTAMMNSGNTVTVTSEPTTPILEASDTEYCYGEAGIDLSVTNTMVGIGYQLIDKDGTGDVVTFVSGNGGVATFPNKIKGTETYKVVAISFNTGCSSESNSITVTENPLPDVYGLEVNLGDGSIEECEAGCTGLTNVSFIELNGSQSDYIYSLLLDGSAIVPEAVDSTGTALPIKFGTRPDGGIYTVLATSDKGCEAVMDGYVKLYEKRLIAIDDILAVPYGDNKADTSVWVNDESDSAIDINVAGDKKNIFFSLVDLSQGSDVDLTVESNRRVELKTNIGNSVRIYPDGKLVFTKLPTYYGLDSIDYVVFNTEYLDRRDTARVYFFAGNYDIPGDNNLLIPNAFSPNGDGFNDEFVISGRFESEVAESKLEVYNRWGSIVYRSKGKRYSDSFWDGTSNTGMVSLGPNLPSGTYFYVFRIDVIVDTTDDGVDNGDKVTKEYSGFIELRR